MTSGLPPRIPITKGQFAETSYSGSLELVDLPRLQDAVSGQDADISLSLQLVWDRAWRRPMVDLDLRLSLVLQCQRCMQAMQWTTQFSNRILLASETEQLDEPDDMDIAQAEAGEVATLRLIEDEILLALPLVPLHGSETPCGRAATNDMATSADKGDNPFAALATLKTKH